MSPLKKLRSSSRLQVLCVLLISAVVYLNILPNGLVWDDEDFILEWKTIRSIKNIPDLARGINPEGHEGVFRPVREVIYATDYTLWGASPVGYHAQAIVLHVASTFLAYCIARKLLNNKTGALITALLFGVHPVHTEAVAFTAASLDLFGKFFVFSSVYTFILALEKKSVRIYLFCIGLTTLAFFSNEQSLILPLLFCLIAFVFTKRETKTWSSLLAYIVPFSLPIVLYFIIRFVLAGNLVRPNVFADNLLSLWLVMFRGFFRYITVLIFPVVLTPIYTISRLVRAGGQASQEVIDQTVFAGAGLLVGYIVLMFASRKKFPVISFGIGWFLISLLPVSNLIPISSVPIAERYLYVPSFGFLLIFGWICTIGIKRARHPLFKWGIVSIVCLIATLYGIRTILRNSDWRSSLSLWQSAYAVSPENPVITNNLGHAYYNEENLEKAEVFFAKTIKLYPAYASAHSNLGGVYLKKQQYQEALIPLLKAYELEPTNIDVLQNLYKAHRNLKDSASAHKLLVDASRASQDPWIFKTLAGLYIEKNNVNEAIGILEKAAQTNSADETMLNNLGALYNSIGQYKKAVSVLTRSISLDSKDPDSFYNLGVAFMLQGNSLEAITAFEKAKEIGGDAKTIDPILKKLYDKQD